MRFRRNKSFVGQNNVTILLNVHITLFTTCLSWLLGWYFKFKTSWKVHSQILYWVFVSLMKSCIIHLNNRSSLFIFHCGVFFCDPSCSYGSGSFYTHCTLPYLHSFSFELSSRLLWFLNCLHFWWSCWQRKHFHWFDSPSPYLPHSNYCWPLALGCCWRLLQRCIWCHQF